jgi:hypothetical protein
MKKVFICIVIIICCIAKSYTQDVYDIKFKAGTVQYSGALVLYSDGTGKMRFKYYNSSTSSNVMVEQTVATVATTTGLTISGSNPVYPGTTTKYPSYNADNFYVTKDTYGGLKITNTDDGGVTASATIKLINGYIDQAIFLKDFNWKLE